MFPGYLLQPDKLTHRSTTYIHKARLSMSIAGWRHYSKTHASSPPSPSINSKNVMIHGSTARTSRYRARILTEELTRPWVPIDNGKWLEKYEDTIGLDGPIVYGQKKGQNKQTVVWCPADDLGTGHVHGPVQPYDSVVDAKMHPVRSMRRACPVPKSPGHHITKRYNKIENRDGKREGKLRSEKREGRYHRSP